MNFMPVRHKRLEEGLSVAAVAQTARRSMGWVYALERGVLTPGRTEAEAIARLLDTEIDALFPRVRDE